MINTQRQGAERCGACEGKLVATRVGVTFLGAGRPMHIRLNQVPAMACASCGATQLSTAVRQHLDELGAEVELVLGQVRTSEVLASQQPPQPQRHVA